MNTDKDPNQPNYTEVVTGMMEPQLNRDARLEYSKYLCDLVDLCVRFRTYNRIELPELWTMIQRYTGETIPGYDPDEDGDDEDAFDELQRNIREQMDGDGNEESRIEYPEEEYRIGMSWTNDEGQGDEDVDDDNQLGGGSGGEALGGYGLGLGAEVDEFLGDDLAGAIGQYPGHPGGRQIDENYSDEDDCDE